MRNLEILILGFITALAMITAKGLSEPTQQNISKIIQNNALAKSK